MKTILTNPLTKICPTRALTLTRALALTLALACPLLSSALTVLPSNPRQNPTVQAVEPPPQNSNPSGAALYGTDKIDLTNLPPTRIGVMPFRHLELQYALAGYRHSRIPLVAFDGTMYFKAGFGDDPGIYFFIPRLAAFSGLSLEHSIDLFFGAILAISFLSGIVGCLVIFDRWDLKEWAAFGLSMLLWFCYRKGDLYIVLAAPIVAIVPWSIYFLRKNSAGAVMGAFLFGVGLLAGFANQIRGQAATALLIFLAILVAFELKRGWGRRALLVLALFAGMAVSVLYFDSLLARRDAYLAAAEPGYTNIVDHHSVWHSLYIGLGYLKNNPYVAGYRDEVAEQEVHSISPTAPMLSPEYERILRHQTLRIARDHPLFILATLIAKLRVILFLLLSWANLGLLAALFYPKDRAMESAFWAALAFTSLFGVIAVPQVQYLLGFMAFANLYGVVSLDYALQVHRPDEFQARLRRFAQKLHLA